MDVTWAPLERVSFVAGYMHESSFQKMESRSRPVTGVNTLDFSDFDWLSDITDTIDTLYSGVKLSLIPKVLDFAFNASYAYALGNTRTRNPTAPVSGTPRPGQHGQGPALPGLHRRASPARGHAVVPLPEAVDGAGRLRLRVLPQERLADGSAQPVHPRCVVDLPGEQPAKLHGPNRGCDDWLQLQVARAPQALQAGARGRWASVDRNELPRVQLEPDLRADLEHLVRAGADPERNIAPGGGAV